MSNQECKEADNDEWQHPDGVISLVIQQHNPGQTCTADNQDLSKKTEDNFNGRSLLIFFVCFALVLTYVLLALPGLELGVTDASGNDIFTSWIPHIPEYK